MLRTRVIPCLLLKNNGLVKTIKFKNPSYVGDPINAVKIFNDKEVDELVFLDITASTVQKGPNFKLLSEISTECFMPLGYGGGIRSLQEIEQLFNLGIEKVSKGSYARKIVLIISDGEDNNSRVSFRKLRNLLKDTNCILKINGFAQTTQISLSISNLLENIYLLHI